MFSCYNPYYVSQSTTVSEIRSLDKTYDSVIIRADAHLNVVKNIPKNIITVCYDLKVSPELIKAIPRHVRFCTPFITESNMQRLALLEETDRRINLLRKTIVHAQHSNPSHLRTQSFFSEIQGSAFKAKRKINDLVTDEGLLVQKSRKI